MALNSKLHTSLIGLIGAAINPPLMAAQNIEIGWVTSVNSSLYQDVGEQYYALPLVIVESERFYLQGTRGGYRFFQDDEGQSLAFEIRYTFDGYQSDDRDALAGMADRDSAWEAGLSYETSMMGGLVETKLMKDISNTHNGYSAQLDYERSLWIDNRLMVSWYTGSEYWNSKKTTYYFGVTPQEAISTRPDYTTDESYSLYLGSNIHKRINDKITFIVNVEYLWMSDAINDSPLTTRQDQWSAYAGVFYPF
jgi:outer membrane protein